MSPAGLAAACHRRPFQRRDLLPVPRKPLQLRPGEQNLHRDSAPPPAAGGLYSGAICSPPPRKALRLRSGEQNLHTDSAPPPGVGRLFSGAICSPPLANPCGSVPGSKFFTEIPRRRLPPAAFSAARFAPRPPQSLAAPSRGAKSSQRFRAAARGRRPFQRRDLLPAPRKALQLRPGEQNLHRDSAPPPATGGLFSSAICSPLPAKSCGSVPGSKIFTEIPRRRLPPAAF